MGEYQYYEFQAVDRALTVDEKTMLRDLSTRAKITNFSFANHYEWGDFRGDVRRLVEDCFDLHLYLSNWGSRRLIIRVPKQVLDETNTSHFLSEIDCVNAWTSGDNLIFDIWCEVEAGYGWVEGSSWLAALTPLRADLLSGDLRLFYLLWLTLVEADILLDDAVEPLAGIGPLTDALNAAVEFFDIDRNLVDAAANTTYETPTPNALRSFVSGITETEKTNLLVRLVGGETHIGFDLLRRARSQNSDHVRARRTVGELRTAAAEICDKRNRAEAEQRKAEEVQKAEKAENALRARLEAIRHLGEQVWCHVESEIERRNATGYDHAAALLADLKQLATEQGGLADFSERLSDIRKRHARKGNFITRVQAL